MLYLLVRLGGDDYAIESKGILRVVPYARLKALPSPLSEIAGVLNYHQTPVPVLDLTRLITGTASSEELGTRIILAEVALPNDATRLLGLLVNEARTVVRFDPGAFLPAGVRPDGTPWLGPVVDHDHRLVQRLEVGRILPEKLLAALMSDAENALAA